MNDIGYMVRRAFRYKALITVSVLLTAVQCVMKLRLPRLMSWAVNTGLQTRDLVLLRSIGLNMLLSCLIMGVSGYCANLSAAVAGQRFGLELRGETYRKISDLSVQQVNRLGTGSLITRLTTDIDICAMLVHAMLLLIMEPVFLTIGGIWMMWRISPLFGLVFLFFIVIQLSVMAVFIGRTAPGFLKVRKTMDAMNSSLQNTFGIFRLIRASGTQTRESGSFDALNTEFYRRSYDVQKLIAFFNPFIMLVMNLSVAAVLYLSGWEISSGRLNVGMLLMAISYSEQVLMSIMTGGQMYKMITETQPSARRIRQILDMEPDLIETGSFKAESLETESFKAESLETESFKAGPLEAEPLCPAGQAAPQTGAFQELIFDDVKFGYSEEGMVLDGLSFSVKGGEIIAVIGPVGCGKSTLAALCARLYDVKGGRILLNGKDIRSLPAAELRRTAALVEKHPAVVEDSLRENIVFGRKDISLQDIERAAEAARFSAFLDPATGGLDRPLLSMGRSLSGGEIQRLAITRALAGRPGLLVLDESTSALDYETEKELLCALRKGYPDLAVLLITSRLPSAQRADRILVLSEGKKAAEGTDEELRSSSRIYQRMCGMRERGA